MTAYLPKVLKFTLLDRPQPVRTPQLPSVLVRNVFSKKECDVIRSRQDDESAWRPFTNRPTTRCKYPREWEYLDESIVDRVDKRTKELNAKYWNIDIVGQYTYPRLLEYTRGHSMGTHVDYQPHCGEYDKLCAILMLSEPTEYVGGALHMGSYVKEPVDLHKGDAVFFPSFVPHFVTRVASGRRLTMAFWSWGPAFR